MIICNCSFSTLGDELFCMRKHLPITTVEMCQRCNEYHGSSVLPGGRSSEVIDLTKRNTCEYSTPTGDTINGNLQFACKYHNERNITSGALCESCKHYQRPIDLVKKQKELVHYPNLSKIYEWCCQTETLLNVGFPRNAMEDIAIYYPTIKQLQDLNQKIMKALEGK